MVRGLAKGAPLRSAALTGGRPWKTQRETLDQVGALPGTVYSRLEARQSRMSAVPG